MESLVENLVLNSIEKKKVFDQTFKHQILSNYAGPLCIFNAFSTFKFGNVVKYGLSCFIYYGNQSNQSN